MQSGLRHSSFGGTGAGPGLLVMHRKTQLSSEEPSPLARDLKFNALFSDRSSIASSASSASSASPSPTPMVRGSGPEYSDPRFSSDPEALEALEGGEEQDEEPQERSTRSGSFVSVVLRPQAQDEADAMVTKHSSFALFSDRSSIMAGAAPEDEDEDEDENDQYDFLVDDDVDDDDEDEEEERNEGEGEVGGEEDQGVETGRAGRSEGDQAEGGGSVASESPL